MLNFNYKSSQNALLTKGGDTMRSMRYYIPGSILILIAILILAVPEILVAFIAALVLVGGVGLLYIGHRFREMENEAWDDDGYQNWHSRDWWTMKDRFFN
jgi:hypothetical protein